MGPVTSGNLIERRRWIVRALLLLAAAIPMVIPLLLIANYGVNVPYWDQWDPDIAGVLIKSHEHTLSFADLVAQHNEHRILVPRLIFLGLAKLTSWNVIAEMFVEWLIACATALGLMILLYQTQRTATRAGPSDDASWQALLRAELATPLKWFLGNLLIFSPSQWENWLWGLGIIYVLPMFFIVMMILLINPNRRGWLKTIAVILLCLAASYSAANGLLAWPIAIVLLAMSGSIADLKQRVPHITAVAIAMLATMWLYSVSYVSPLPVNAPSDGGIGRFIKYVLVYAGNSFIHVKGFGPVVIATISGVIALLLFLTVLLYLLVGSTDRRTQPLIRAAMPWVMIGGFSVISALLAAVSHSRFGLDQAVTSRYVTFAVYLSLSLIALVPLVCADVHARWTPAPLSTRWLLRIPSIALGAWLMLATLMSIPNWISTCEITNLNRIRGKAAVLLVNILPDNPHLAAVMHPNAKLLAEQAKRINELGYLDPPLIRIDDANEISASPAMTKQVVRGLLEHYGTLDKEGDLIGVQGFALFPYKHSPADTVFLTATGDDQKPRIFTIAQTAMQRLEKAEEFGHARYGLSGWRATFVSRRLPVGNALLIEAWALDSNTGQAYRLEGSFTATRGAPQTAPTTAP